MKQWKTAQVRSAIYEFLSVCFLYPDADRMALLRASGGGMVHLVESRCGSEAAEHLSRFAAAVSELAQDEMEEQFFRVFGHALSADCPPYEGEYGQSHIFDKSQTLADLGSYFNAFGVEVSAELKDRMDHISVELEFMHLLAMKEAYALTQRHGRAKVGICREAQRSFLQDHLGSWACTFAGRLGQVAGEGPYGELARSLDCFIRQELADRGLKPGPERPVVPMARPEEDPDCDACPLMAEPEMEVTVP